MKFELVVKTGIKEIAKIEGNSISEDILVMADVNKVIEVEQYLERMLGHRFHINQIPEAKCQS